jgi:threonine aldolase
MGVEMIDFRSDTLTRPDAGMLEAMMKARVGDDVFGEDPTIKELEGELAGIFSMEAALFCPSGTMANQIALAVHTRPGDEVICAEGSHIYMYEGGAPAANAGISVQLLPGDCGRLNAAQIKEAVKPDNPHYPRTSLVSLENTCNRGGGSVYNYGDLSEISEFCRGAGLSIHLDGARIFNALAAQTDYTAKDIGRWFDSVSVCLSKGLGAPVGTVLLGNKAFIAKALRVRKRWGGGMRQAGYLAAAGLYAVRNNIRRIAIDHNWASQLAAVLSTASFCAYIIPPQTNIVVVGLKSDYKVESVLNALQSKGIAAIGFGADQIRFVTHLDISEEAMLQALQIIKGWQY